MSNFNDAWMDSYNHFKFTAICILIRHFKIKMLNFYTGSPILFLQPILTKCDVSNVFDLTYQANSDDNGEV